MYLEDMAFCLLPYLMKIRSVKFFFLISCISFSFTLLLVHLLNHRITNTNESLIEEVIQNVEKDFRYINVYRNIDYLPTDLKYILLWTDRDYAPFSFMKDGQRSFLENNCSMINCYVTANKYLFGDNYTNFHAIAFNGRNMKVNDFPSNRSPHQKYIYFNMESSENFPVCDPIFDGFFNLTATYKLNSDMLLPYILIKDRNEVTIGPKLKMKWMETKTEANIPYNEIIKNKTKAVAWFVSNCLSYDSGRNMFVKTLKEELETYGHKIDVYGDCGTLTCPRSEQSKCDLLLKRDYFFYLALENSFMEDYVTEKLLTALNNDVVPIVYGGADYSRFLPPGSYIDGNKYKMRHLAALLNKLINSPKTYGQYFNWKKYYTFHDPQSTENICGICIALNNKTLMERTTIYKHFRSWWQPKYMNICK